MQLGILYGISVGTGDPDLITVKGLRILQTVDIVTFPQGIGDKLGVAEKIIRQWLKPQQTTIALDFPYVREQDILESAWQKSAKIIGQYLQQGKNVAFACEGDVSFYSTFTYLANTLKQLHPEAIIETVPGVCSPTAAASDLQIPLTVRNQRLTILPAMYTVEELETALDSAEVVVLLKVSSVYQQVWQILQKRGLLNSSWVVEKASYSDRKIYRNLQLHPNLKLPYFSLLLIQVC
ncbi:MAG: precorrin-2 C(20)-methyltransferase [Xenococcaceae cyanobacterium MO_167.B52]|nr:precorrin-2 C(20)-methyltransferase [Xenococcaceae cyanobacterium MO_167.B52]